MKTSRFIVGLILVIAAALLFLLGKGACHFRCNRAGVLGLVSIAISRRK